MNNRPSRGGGEESTTLTLTVLRSSGERDEVREKAARLFFSKKRQKWALSWQ